MASSPDHSTYRLDNAGKTTILVRPFQRSLNAATGGYVGRRRSSAAAIGLGLYARAWQPRLDRSTPRLEVAC